MTHILVVEDDVATRLLFTAVLRRAGVACTAVGDGPSAIAAITDFAFDGVLLDLILPGASGYEVLDHIRRAGDGLAARVVVCSAVPPYLIEMEKLRGVAAVLPKPADMQALTAAVMTAAAGIHA